MRRNGTEAATGWMVARWISDTIKALNSLYFHPPTNQPPSTIIRILFCVRKGRKVTFVLEQMAQGRESSSRHDQLEMFLCYVPHVIPSKPHSLYSICILLVPKEFPDPFSSSSGTRHAFYNSKWIGWSDGL